MALFSIQNSKAQKISSLKVKLEKDIQKIFEENLSEILDISFLASEYSTSFGGRIDSLGIDNNGAPVIIEYKRSQNDSVINQGLSYLRWLLDHKADFEALMRRENISVDIDWDSPRVICVAESYNKFDLDTADILPINIELLKFRIYQHNILLVEPETQQKVRISTSKVFGKGDKEKKIKEKITYMLEDHLRDISSEAKNIFEVINEKIMSLDESIIMEPKAKYIAYKLAKNFVDIAVTKHGLKIFINMQSGQLNDPHDIARDLTKPMKVGHWGNGDYEVKLEREKDIEKVFELIKQSYVYHK